jgi:hypothetical protein
VMRAMMASCFFRDRLRLTLLKFPVLWGAESPFRASWATDNRSPRPQQAAETAE